MKQAFDMYLMLGCAVGFCLVVLTGCGSPSGRQALGGTVLIDGQPLSVGSVRFRPLAGTKGPTAGGQIRAGKFSVAPDQGVLAGKFRVEITATRKTGSKMPAALGDGMVDVMEQYIPVRYNRQSELVAEVTDTGPSQFEFALSSQ